MTFYAHLKERSVLALSGKDAIVFSQGICTQDIEKLPEETLSYGVHLTSQGRFLYDFFILKKEGKIWLDCAAHELMDLAKSLHGYMLNYQVEFEDLTDDIDIFAIWDGHGEGYPDPRHPKLGQRAYLPKGEPPKATQADYETHRINLSIPDGSKDAVKNKTFTAELGLEFLKGVAFDKGCYVGQELVARLHYRTEPKQKLYQVALTAAIPHGTAIMAGDTEAGKILSGTKNTALALIKTRYLEKELSCNGQTLQPQTPEWWK